MHSRAAPSPHRRQPGSAREWRRLPLSWAVGAAGTCSPPGPAAALDHRVGGACEVRVCAASRLQQLTGAPRPLPARVGGAANRHEAGAASGPALPTLLPAPPKPVASQGMSLIRPRAHATPCNRHSSQNGFTPCARSGRAGGGRQLLRPAARGDPHYKYPIRPRAVIQLTSNRSRALRGHWRGAGGTALACSGLPPNFRSFSVCSSLPGLKAAPASRSQAPSGLPHHEGSCLGAPAGAPGVPDRSG